MKLDLYTIDSAVKELLITVSEEVILPMAETMTEQSRQFKAGGEIVTVVDKTVEDILVSSLKDLIPECNVLGEEMVSAEPERLQARLNDGYLWVIDPIDGTRNYFNQDNGRYAVIIALLKDGAPIAGWIYEPQQNQLISSVQGISEPSVNDNVIERPQALDQTFQSLKGFCFCRVFPDNIGPEIRANLKDFSYESLHCIGAEYVDIILGRADFAIFPRSRLWDHAAGAYILTQKGGVAKTLNELPITVSSLTQGPQWIIAAQSEYIWAMVKETVFNGVNWHDYCTDIS